MTSTLSVIINDLFEQMNAEVSWHVQWLNHRIHERCWQTVMLNTAVEALSQMDPS
jgi:hypothetical protein